MRNHTYLTMKVRLSLRYNSRWFMNIFITVKKNLLTWSHQSLLLWISKSKCTNWTGILMSFQIWQIVYVKNIMYVLEFAFFLYWSRFTVWKVWSWFVLVSERVESIKTRTVLKPIIFCLFSSQWSYFTCSCTLLQSVYKEKFSFISDILFNGLSSWIQHLSGRVNS